MSRAEPFGAISIIAHRGASSIAPENTLLAAEAAYLAGADMWELDVRMTADEHLVLFHDDQLALKTDIQEKLPAKARQLVEELTLAELQTLDISSWYVNVDPFEQIRAGVLSQAQAETMRNQRTNTLREALEWTRAHKWRVNVEIKEKEKQGGNIDLSIAHKCIDLFEELGMVDDILMSSFCVEYLQLARERSVQLSTGWLVLDPVADPVTQLQLLDAQAYHPLWTQAAASSLEAVRAAGFAVNVWTVDELDDAREMVALGATGIITNYPQRF